MTIVAKANAIAMARVHGTFMSSASPSAGLEMRAPATQSATLRDAPLPVVTAVSRDGDKTIVEMQRTYETSNEVDCKEIHPLKVVRVAEDGVVYYAHRCKQEKLRYDTTDLVTFDMLPAGVTIAKGDLLSMWYVVDSKQEKAVVNKPLKKHFKEQRKLTALHLIAVHSADATVKHGPYLEE